MASWRGFGVECWKWRPLVITRSGGRSGSWEASGGRLFSKDIDIITGLVLETDSNQALIFSSGELPREVWRWRQERGMILASKLQYFRR